MTENLKNKITLGDCMDVMRGMPDGSIGMIATDPPYGVSLKMGTRKNLDGTPKQARIKGDDNLRWLADFYREAFRVLKDGGMLLTFYGWPNADEFMGGAKMAGFRPVSHFVWIKEAPGIGYYTMGQHECCFAFAKGKPPKPNSNATDVLYCRRMAQDDTNHPTPKPIDLMAQLVRRFHKPGDVVFDPFSGSASTAFACRNLGVDFIAVEISPEWHADSVRRMTEYDRQPNMFKAMAEAT